VTIGWIIGWLRLVGSLSSFTENRLFYRALLQKRDIISWCHLISSETKWHQVTREWLHCHCDGLQRWHVYSPSKVIMGFMSHAAHMTHLIMSHVTHNTHLNELWVILDTLPPPRAHLQAFTEFTRLLADESTKYPLQRTATHCNTL